MTDLTDKLADALECAQSLSIAWAGYYSQSPAYKTDGEIHVVHREILNKIQSALDAYRAQRDGEREAITREWLLSQGFREVPSGMGPDYADHLEKDALNVWEFNDTGEWLFNECYKIGVRTRGELRSLAALLNVDIRPLAKGEA